jgi:hypothetical protein
LGFGGRDRNGRRSNKAERKNRKLHSLPACMIVADRWITTVNPDAQYVETGVIFLRKPCRRQLQLQRHGIWTSGQQPDKPLALGLHHSCRFKPARRLIIRL